MTQRVLGFLLLLSLGACADTGSCIARDGADTQPCTAGAIQYTNTPTQAAPQRVVPVQIDGKFSLYERAKIARAVNEWNFALNGQVRLDISPVVADAAPYVDGRVPRSEGWLVARIDSKSPAVANSTMSRALAVTVGSRKATVYVIADRLGSRDLGAIMLHEFGHALGAGHDSRGQLMHPYYTGDKQRCIDKGAVQAVAAAQRLPADQLNWCLGARETHVAAAGGHKH